jgi:hypothetical protein
MNDPYLLFYCWQLWKKGDHKKLTEVVEKAVKQLEDDGHKIEYEKYPTGDLSGSPAIINAIHEKIKRADCFIADFCLFEREGKHFVNPNVAIELGYAQACLDSRKIIIVTSDKSLLPFDVQNYRANQLDELDPEKMSDYIKQCFLYQSRHRFWKRHDKRCVFCQINDVDLNDVCTDKGDNGKYVQICKDCLFYLRDRFKKVDCEADRVIDSLIGHYSDTEFDMIDRGEARTIANSLDLNQIGELNPVSKLMYFIKNLERIDHKLIDGETVTSITDFLVYSFKNDNEVSELVLQRMVHWRIADHLTVGIHRQNVYVNNNLLLIILLLARDRQPIYDTIQHFHYKFRRSMELGYIMYTITRINSWLVEGRDNCMGSRCDNQKYCEEFNYNRSLRRLDPKPKPIDNTKINVFVYSINPFGVSAIEPISKEEIISLRRSNRSYRRTIDRYGLLPVSQNIPERQGSLMSKYREIVHRPIQTVLSVIDRHGLEFDLSSTIIWNRGGKILRFRDFWTKEYHPLCDTSKENSIIMGRLKLIPIPG